MMDDPKRKAEYERKQKEAEEKAKMMFLPRFTPEIEKPELTDEQFDENVEFVKNLDGMPCFKEFDDFASKYEDAD